MKPNPQLFLEARGSQRANATNRLPTKRCYRGRHKWREEHLMDIKVLGIDLGETVCSLTGLNEAGAVVFLKRLQRHRLFDLLATLSLCVVAVEYDTPRSLDRIWRNFLSTLCPC